MANPVILVHGVGKGFSVDHKVKSILDTDRDVLLFDYSNLLETSVYSNLFPNFLLNPLKILQDMEDNVDDVLSYFLDKKIRKKVVDDFINYLRSTNCNGCTIIAHSLGSVVVWDALQELSSKEDPLISIDNVVFIGSPLYLNMAWWLCSHNQPLVNITSIKGNKDPVCYYGKRTRGFDVEVDRRMLNHDLHAYLADINVLNSRLNIV